MQAMSGRQTKNSAIKNIYLNKNVYLKTFLTDPIIIFCAPFSQPNAEKTGGLYCPLISLYDMYEQKKIVFSRIFL